MRASYLWAGLIAILVAGWFASGNMEALGLKKPQTAKTITEPVKKKAEKPFRVEVKRFTAQMRPTTLYIRGRTQAKKQVNVLARTSGIVEEARFEQGDRVKAGDLLCRLDMRDRKARLAQAKAQLASAKRDYEAARKLVKRKFTSEAKLAIDRARYDQARAAIEQIELDITYTRVTAPISGIITSFKGEEGTFLQTGSPCAVVSVFNPMLVVAQVGERDIARIKMGQTAGARLVTGKKVSGKVTFISPSAEVATRTFKVEVSIDNADNKLSDGVTAEIVFPLQPVKAHLIPAGVIGLNDKGEIGVRTVTDDNKALFVPVKIVGQTRSGTWVKGLPETATLIIAGQDYVLDGQTVDPVVAEEPAS